MKVSVIIPSTGRAEQLIACVGQLLKVSPEVEIVVVIEHDPDSSSLLRKQCFPIKIIYRQEHRGPIYGWNEGASYASGDAFVLGSDDNWFHEGWLEEALIALDSIGGSGLVGLNTMNPKKHYQNWDDAYLVTRDYCKSAFGGVLCVPRYFHYGIDVEACTHAMDDGRYVYAEKSIVEHKHPSKNEEKDATYMIYDEYHLIDAMIVQSRKNMGWPIDYDPVF